VGGDEVRISIVPIFCNEETMEKLATALCLAMVKMHVQTATE
jgi:hypothetical protein